jgi:hypothetical protein
MQRQKSAASNSTVSHYSTRCVSIYSEICLFCFTKCRSNYELKFLGVVDPTHRQDVYYFQIFFTFSKYVFCELILWRHIMERFYTSPSRQYSTDTRETNFWLSGATHPHTPIFFIVIKKSQIKLNLPGNQGWSSLYS